MDRLAELREKRGLTLRELSKMSGVSPDTINQIELGHRKARPSTLRKLAKSLDLKVQDFFKDEELATRPKEEPPLPFEAETNERERRLEEQIEGIPKTLKSYLKGRIEEHGQELKDPDSLHFRTPESASLWAEMVSREGQSWTAWVHANRDALVPPHDKKSVIEVLLSTWQYTGDLTGHSILTFRELVRRAEKRIAAMEGPIDELAARRMKDATAALEDAQRRDKEMQSASG